MLGAVSNRLRRLPAATPLLVGVVLLVLLAVLSATGESAVEVGQGWVPGFDQAEEAPPSLFRDPGDDFQTPPVLRAVLAGVMLLIMLATLVLILLGLLAIVLGARFERRRRRKKARAIGIVGEAAEHGDVFRIDLMRRAAGGALEWLQARSGDPGDAVVLAWLMLEQAAADSGLVRQPHQTPTEFTSAVLAQLRVDAGALDRLRRLYQRARFSGHQVTEDDVQAAQDALHRVIDDLGTAAAGTQTAVAPQRSPT